MTFVSQDFSKNEYNLEFREINFNNNTCLPNKTTVRIYIRISNELFAVYQRTFEKKLTPQYYKNFTKKFMEDPIYRQKYIFEDSQEWLGVMTYNDLPSHVHEQCKASIDILNNKEDVKFRDLVKLKTFGWDIFSHMPLEKLKNYIEEDSFQKVISVFEEPNDRLNAIRWIARGLIPTLSIYKVKVDKEVDKNKKNTMK